MKLTSRESLTHIRALRYGTLSLVDPDNRRPVDYDMRRNLLEVRTLSGGADVMKLMDEGMPKLWTIHKALDSASTSSGFFRRRWHLHTDFCRGPNCVIA